MVEKLALVPKKAGNKTDTHKNDGVKKDDKIIEKVDRTNKQTNKNKKIVKKPLKDSNEVDDKTKKKSQEKVKKIEKKSG